MIRGFNPEGEFKSAFKMKFFWRFSIYLNEVGFEFRDGDDRPRRDRNVYVAVGIVGEIIEVDKFKKRAKLAVSYSQGSDVNFILISFFLS